MLVKISTDKTVSVAAAALQAAVQANHFGVMQVHNLKETMAMKGVEFAIMDANGFIRILTSREIELTKKINPKAFQMPGYGLKHFCIAPEIPPLPVPPEAG